MPKPLLSVHSDPQVASTDAKPVRKIRTISVDAPPDFVPSATLPLPSSVPADKVDAAIQKGVLWLREHPEQWLSGGSHGYALGYVALPGLALLESGIDPTDPQIQKAARKTRDMAPSETRTYEISLAILFLDRLGDPADDALIRSLAARLIAGQTSQYGWTYNCRLSSENEAPLLKALDKMRPQIDLLTPLTREQGKGLIELPIPLAGDAKLPIPIGGDNKPAPKRDSSKMAMAFDLSPDAKQLVKELPVSLQHIPVFDPETTAKPRRNLRSRNSGDDNSNTQFAMLALWTAQRHGVPVERSLLLADQRFAQTQLSGGGWGYHIDQNHATPSMTCVGLLGLAVGHGSLLGSDKKGRGVVDDPAIQKGIEALSKSVGVAGDPDDNALLNLYKLWSIERVCVLYGLPRIAGKDWYGWGAKRILREQHANGSWNGGGYPGSTATTDTSFALLFLRRSNLVQDLTDRLQLHMPIRDPDRP